MLKVCEVAEMSGCINLLNSGLFLNVNDICSTDKYRGGAPVPWRMGWCFVCQKSVSVFMGQIMHGSHILASGGKGICLCGCFVVHPPTVS